MLQDNNRLVVVCFLPPSIWNSSLRSSLLYLAVVLWCICVATLGPFESTKRLEFLGSICTAATLSITFDNFDVPIMPLRNSTRLMYSDIMSRDGLLKNDQFKIFSLFSLSHRLLTLASPAILGAYDLELICTERKPLFIFY